MSVERNTRTTAGTGQRVDGWALLFKRWGSVRQVNGGERFQGHQLQADVDHLVFLPSDTGTRGMTVKDRLLVKGKVLSIVSVYDVELAGVEVMVQCKESV